MLIYVPILLCGKIYAFYCVLSRRFGLDKCGKSTCFLFLIIKYLYEWYITPVKYYYFRRVKTRATILSVIVCILIMQPLLAGFGLPEAYTVCKPATEEEESCSSSCSSEAPPEEDDCERPGCNPLLGCSSGNFYIHDYATISLTTLLIPKKKLFVTDDNRLLEQLNECWHPPENI